MAKYEYWILPINEEFLMKEKGSVAQDNLNLMGQDGWDIAVSIPSTKPGDHILILHRESN